MGNFYGISGIHIIDNGSWCDPGIVWHRHYYNYWCIEDALWEIYKEECCEQHEEPSEKYFEDEWMINNAATVRNYLGDCEFGRCYEGTVYRVKGDMLGFTHKINFQDGTYKYVNLKN